MQMSVTKLLAAQWVVELHSYLAARPAIIVNGFCSAGIVDCIGFYCISIYIIDFIVIIGMIQQFTNNYHYIQFTAD